MLIRSSACEARLFALTRIASLLRRTRSLARSLDSDGSSDVENEKGIGRIPSKDILSSAAEELPEKQLGVSLSFYTKSL